MAHFVVKYVISGHAVDAHENEANSGNARRYPKDILKIK